MDVEVVNISHCNLSCNVSEVIKNTMALENHTLSKYDRFDERSGENKIKLVSKIDICNASTQFLQ